MFIQVIVHNKRLAIAVMILIAAMALNASARLPSVHHPVWNIDEAVESIVAHDMMEQKVIYRDTVTHRGPMQHFVLTLLFSAAGRFNMTAVHCALLVCVLLTMFLLFRIGCQKKDPLLGALSALLFGLFTLVPAYYDSLAFHTENLLVLFSTAGVLLTLKGWAGRNGLFFIGAGVCLGFAFFSKQPAFLDFFSISAALALAGYAEGKFRESLDFLAYISCGFLIVCLSFTLYFFVHGALDYFLYYFWFYNTDVYMPARPFAERWRRFFTFFTDEQTKYLAFFFSTAYGIYPLRVFLDARRRAPFFFFRLLIFLWALGGYFAAAATGRGFGHYYLQAMAPVSLVSADLALSVYKRILAKKNFACKMTAAGLACVLLLTLGGFTHRVVTKTLRYYELPHIPMKMDKLVHYIRQNSSPQDRILIWGFMAELYVLTQRLPASRFNQTNFLTGYIPWMNGGAGIDTSETIVPGAWNLFMRDLYREKPLLIIDTSPGNFCEYGKYPPEKYAILYNFIEQFYTLDKRIKYKGRIYIRIFKRKDTPEIPAG